MKIIKTIDDKEIVFDFELTKILTTKFLINETIEGLEKPKEKQPVKFDYGIGLGFMTDKRLVKIHCNFNCVIDNDSKHNAVLSTDYIFTVSNLDVFVNEDHSIGIPLYFLATMVGLALSTNRGIWYEKTAGSNFSRALFPIVDPTPIAKDIIEKRVQESHTEK